MERELLQTNEFKNILSGGDHFPNDFTRNMQKELKLLAVTGGVLWRGAVTGVQPAGTEYPGHIVVVQEK